MGVYLCPVMEPEASVRMLKQQVEEEGALSLHEKLKKTSLTVVSLEAALKAKAAEAREIQAKNAGVIENKNREIAVLSKQLNTARDQVSALKSSVTNLTNEKAAAERATLQKEGQLRGLQNQIEEMQKRLEFKSSLERSFDSLQAKYQAKVDELAKIRRSASPDPAKVDVLLQKPAFKPAAVSQPGY